MRRKTISALMMSLVLVMCLLFQSWPVSATEKKDSAVNNESLSESDVIEELADQLSDETKDPFNYQNGDSEKKKFTAKSVMPSSYDLRHVDTDGDGEGDTSYVTPVKCQSPFASCWGFAATAAAETSVLGSGLAAVDKYGARADSEKGIKELNLSEKHSLNFVMSPMNYPGDPQDGEGMYYLNEKASFTDKLAMGGMSIFCTSLYASGTGVILEDSVTKDGEYIFEYKGIYEDGQQAITTYTENGVEVDYCYSKEGDWTLPAVTRFYQSYKLNGSYILPCPAQFYQSLKTENYIYNAAGTYAIKEQLLQNRGVSISFHADTSRPDQENEGKYISKNWAHYTYEYTPVNHSVTIVGYDDNYPRSNFLEGHQPPANGAWLVKNSWGSGEEKFPNRGKADWGLLQGQDTAPYEATSDVHTGYFWLSYYDMTICMPEALSFDLSNVENSYTLYMHDLMPVSQYRDGSVANKASMSNVFKAESDLTLDQVSCLLAQPNTKVQYDIYLLAPDAKTPDDGVWVAGGKTSAFAYGGYKKITLDDPIMIQKGQTFAIVIIMINSDGSYNLVLQTASSKKGAQAKGEVRYMKGVINPGESFVSINGVWYDYSSESFRNKLLKDSNGYLASDNFSIKAYTRKADYPTIAVSPGENIQLDLGDNQTGSFTLSIEGAAEGSELPEIDCFMKEGGEEFVTMTPGSKENTYELKALKAGQAIIMASADGVGAKVFSVNVSGAGKYTVNDLNLKVGETGTMSVKDLEGNPVSGLTYSSGNTSIAQVSQDGTVTAVGAGTVTVTATDSEGAYAASTVTVTKVEESLLAKAVAKGKKKAKISWNGVSDADRYLIYMAKAGGSLKNVKTVSADTKSFIQKGLKKQTNYSFKVCAQKKEGSSYKTVKTSLTGYFVTGNASKKFTNPKSITVNTSKLTLAKGKTASLKVNVTKVKKKKKLLTKYAAIARYISTDSSVAAVTAAGTIKAVKAGSCKVHVQTINGMWKTVAVTVE